MDLILLIAAVVCFLVGAFGVPAKVNLVAIGLALWCLTNLV